MCRPLANARVRNERFPNRNRFTSTQGVRVRRKSIIIKRLKRRGNAQRDSRRRPRFYLNVQLFGVVRLGTECPPLRPSHPRRQSAASYDRFRLIHRRSKGFRIILFLSLPSLPLSSRSRRLTAQRCHRCRSSLELWGPEEVGLNYN